MVIGSLPAVDLRRPINLVLDDLSSDRPWSSGRSRRSAPAAAATTLAAGKSAAKLAQALKAYDAARAAATATDAARTTEALLALEQRLQELAAAGQELDRAEKELAQLQAKIARLAEEAKAARRAEEAKAGEAASATETGAQGETEAAKAAAARKLTSELIAHPESLVGKSPQEIGRMFEDLGLPVEIKQGTRGSKRSVQVYIDRKSPITKVEVHPGGGRHGGAYYKISTSTNGTIRVIDPMTYIGDTGQDAVVKVEGLKSKLTE